MECLTVTDQAEMVSQDTESWAKGNQILFKPKQETNHKMDGRRADLTPM